MLRLLVLLAGRNARRRRVRTLLTASMVAFGVGLLVVALAWLEGIFGKAELDAAGLAGHVRVVSPGYAEREQLMPLHENIPDVAPLVERLRAQPGVVDVYAKVATGVTVTAGEEIGDVFGLVVGADPEYFEKYVGLRDQVMEGAWFSGKRDELLLGSQLAEKTGARVGDEVVLLGRTQYGSMSPIKGSVTGIIGGLGAFERQIVVPLDRVQWLADMEGGATEVMVFGGHHETAVALAQQLRSAPGLEGYTVEAWSQRPPFNTIKGMTGAVGGIISGIVVFLVALGIWNTMMMSVLERTHEVGVMRAMGLSSLAAVALFLVEAAAIGLGGGLAGIALGAGPAWWLETRGVSFGEQTARQMSETIPIEATVYADLTPELMGLCLLLGLVMAVLGGTLPAIRAAGIQPVAAMRSGR